MVSILTWPNSGSPRCPGQLGKGLPTNQTRLDQLVAAIDAANNAGVKQIVFMSAAGRKQREEPAPGASYWLDEQQLMKTAQAWTSSI